jgi:hypothetical protein
MLAAGVRPFNGRDRDPARNARSEQWLASRQLRLPRLRHHGTVSNSAELAAVLRRIAELLSRPDVDTAWSGYEPDELRSEIYSFLERAGAGLPLDEAGRDRLRLLFAPTGALQETSLSSGWGQEFVALATRFDDAV